MAHGNLKRRAPGSRTPKDRIVIYTEGAVTEVEYLRTVRERFSIPKELVIIKKSECTHPDGIVDEAIEAKKRNKSESKKGRDTLVDQWWAVFDTEGHPASVASAIRKADDNGVYVALSDPSFEFWLRLHFGYTTRQYQSVQELIRELNADGLLPGYTASNKHPDMTLLYPLLPNAVRNARQLRAHFTERGNEQPRTDCDLLVDAIAAQAKDGVANYDVSPFDSKRYRDWRCPHR